MKHTKHLLMRTLICLLLVIVPMFGTVSVDLPLPTHTRPSFASEKTGAAQRNFIRSKYSFCISASVNESSSAHETPAAIKEFSYSSAIPIAVKLRLRQKNSSLSNLPPALVEYYGIPTCKIGLMYSWNELRPSHTENLHLNKIKKLE